MRRLPILIALAGTMFLSAVAYRAQAVPAYRGAITVAQPDGTTLTLKMHGDEFCGWATTSDGYTVVQGADGFYYYAQLGAGNSLQPTAVRVNEPSRRTSAERSSLSRFMRGMPAAVARSIGEANRRRMNTGAGEGLLQRSAASRSEATRSGGKFKSLVILVNFKDKGFTIDNPRQAFTDLLNKDGYSRYNGEIGSAWNYYYDNSNGRFDPDFVVVGPYTLSQNMNYYGARSGNSNDANPRAMAQEAAQLALNDGVNYAEYSDDGVVRDIFIFYAGYNEAEGGGTNTVWPHRWPGTLNVGSYRIAGYACTSEYKGANGDVMAGIGTFCHEFGHVLGWPDFYDADYDANGLDSGLDQYSLMSGGSYNGNGRIPPALNAIERNMVGWLDYTPLEADGAYSIAPVHKDVAYKLETDVEGEYFVFETRSRASKWDNGISTGSSLGMLVYHVDQSSTFVSEAGMSAKQMWDFNAVNNYSTHPCATIVKASGNIDAWTFPGVANKTTLSHENNAAFRFWSGANANLKLSGISFSGENTTFNVSTAQNSIAVAGSVRSKEGAPVGGAKVSISPVTGSRMGLMSILRRSSTAAKNTTTAADGSFSLGMVDVGEYVLTVEKVGFQTYNENVYIRVERNMVITLATPLQSASTRYTWSGEFFTALGMGINQPVYAVSKFDFADMGGSGSTPIVLSGMDLYVHASNVNVTALVYKNGVEVFSKELSDINIGAYNYVDLGAAGIQVSAGDYVYVGGRYVSSTRKDAVPLDDGNKFVSGKGLLYGTDGTSWNTDMTFNLLVGVYSSSDKTLEVSFDKSSFDLKVGDYTTLAYTQKPANIPTVYEWKSNNEKVVVCTPDGHVKAVGAGEANVSISSPLLPSDVSCRVNVTPEIEGEPSVKVNGTEVTVSWKPVVSRSKWVVSWKHEEDTEYNSLETSTTSASLPDILLNSRYEVRVNGLREDGELWGFATTQFETAAADAVKKINLGVTECSVMMGQTYTFDVSFEPADAYNTVLDWSSSNPEIVSVAEDGTVTGVSAGVAVITATTRYGSDKVNATCEVACVNSLDDVVVAYNGQYEAELSWAAAPHEGSYRVSYASKGGETVTVETDEKRIYISGLTMDTTYNVTVTALNDNGGEGSSVEMSFTTERRRYDFAHIVALEDSYRAGDKLRLSVFDSTDSLKSIEWTLDGTKVEPPTVELTSGRHTLEATITDATGYIDHVIKVLNVK